MACVCSPNATCVHHASGGLLALLLFAAAGVGLAAARERLARR